MFCSDLSVHAVAELDAVVAELNDRPRKRLAFSKPIEELGPLLLRSPREPKVPLAVIAGQERGARDIGLLNGKSRGPAGQQGEQTAPIGAVNAWRPPLNCIAR
jgi:hypothetical protein